MLSFLSDPFRNVDVEAAYKFANQAQNGVPTHCESGSASFGQIWINF